MTFEILPSSEKALQRAESNKPGKPQKYPFDLLEVGQSFAVKSIDVKLQSMRVLISYHNRKDDGKRFRVINHGDLIEVARIA